MNSPTNLRVVIDTNVLISGLTWGGNPWQVIREWKKGLYDLLISPFILAELNKFLDEHEAELRDKTTVIDKLKNKTIKIIPPKKITICRDIKDNQILDLCLVGKADYLITGDKDLLILKKFKNTIIVKPKKFLKLKPFSTSVGS